MSTLHRGPFVSLCLVLGRGFARCGPDPVVRRRVSHTARPVRVALAAALSLCLPLRDTCRSRFGCLVGSQFGVNWVCRLIWRGDGAIVSAFSRECQLTLC